MTRMRTTGLTHLDEGVHVGRIDQDACGGLTHPSTSMRMQMVRTPRPYQLSRDAKEEVESGQVLMPQSSVLNACSLFTP
jgi:hypothetical protein